MASARAPGRRRRPGGLASPVTAGPSATPTRSRPRRPARPPRPASSPPGTTATPSALPPGWTANRPATRQWNGKGAPGTEDSAVDLSTGPAGSRPGRWRHRRGTAWRLTPQRPSGPPPPPTRARQSRNPTRRSRSAANPPGCSACNARQGGGFLVETAVTVHAGPLSCSRPKTRRAAADHRADRAAFQLFLGGIRLPR